MTVKSMIYSSDRSFHKNKKFYKMILHISAFKPFFKKMDESKVLIIILI